MRFRKFRTSYLFILGAVLIFFGCFIYVQTKERINLIQSDFDSNEKQSSNQTSPSSPSVKKLKEKP